MPSSYVTDAFSPEELLNQKIPPSTISFEYTHHTTPNDCGLPTDRLHTAFDWNLEPFEEALKCARFHDMSRYDFILEPGDNPYFKYIRPVLGLVNEEFYLGSWTIGAVSVLTSIDGASCYKLFRYQETDSIDILDPEDDKEDIVGIAYFVAPGAITVDEWTSHKPLSARRSSSIHLILPALLKQCQISSARFALLSDGQATLLFQLDALKISGNTVPVVSLPEHRGCYGNVRKSLAFLIHHEATLSRCCVFNGRPHLAITLGPLPNDSLIAAMTTAQYKCMQDFDRRTVEKRSDPRIWNHFSLWKKNAAQFAQLHPLLPAQILFGEVGSFLQRHNPWRSPYPSHPLPAQELATLTRYYRIKDNSTTSMLQETGSRVVFFIDEIVRTGWETYSQVVFGHIVDKTGRSSGRLCLKLYDERLFPDPQYRPNQSSPLSAWNVAEDMARREEAAYDRLSHLQGSLLPHSFGFHYFTLPDGHRCLGFLMEMVVGPSLETLQPSEWNTQRKASFIKLIRTAFKGIRYEGINQTDWHPDQFIFPACSEEDMEAGTPAVVCIDFAFALQHFCLCHTPIGQDWQSLKASVQCITKVDEAFIDAHFPERDRWEW